MIGPLKSKVERSKGSNRAIFNFYTFDPSASCVFLLSKALLAAYDLLRVNSSIFPSQRDGDKGTHEVQSTTSKLLRGGVMLTRD